MWKFAAEDKVFQIGRVKIGGKFGYAPTVLIGTLFYNKHYIMKDEMKGEFDREEAEKLIKRQEEFSDKIDNPHMVDVVGASPEALHCFLDFVTGVTDAPILLDGVSAGIRIPGLDYVKEQGLQDRIVYNSPTPDYKKEELEKIKEVGIKSALILAFNTKEFTSQGENQGDQRTAPCGRQRGCRKTNH